MSNFSSSEEQNENGAGLLEPCEYELIGNITIGLQVYSGIFAAINFIVLVVSLFVWLWNKDLPYLKKRNFSQILFLCVSWVSNLFARPIPKAASGQSSVLTSCIFISVAFALFPPCMMFPQMIRVILVHNRVKLNRKISGLFQERKVSNQQRFQSQIEGRMEIAEANDEVRKLRFLASQRFGDILTVFGLFLSGIFAFSLAYFNCPSLGGETCTMVSMADVKQTLIFVIPAFFAFFFIIFIQVKVGGYPDPFYILSEIRNGFFIASFFIVPSLIFAFIDVGEFEDQVPKRFDFSVLFDIGVFVYFLYTIPYQIYQARKFDLKHVIVVNGFEELMRTSIGRRLFRQHLVNEFSVENLNLYEAGLAYKKMFVNNIDGDTRRKVAENLYTRYLKPMQQSQVNLPPHVVAEVSERLNTTVAVYEDLFDHVLDEVYRLMKYDSFSRFQRTQAYKDYLGMVEIDNVGDNSL